jgi:hypothetical protein
MASPKAHVEILFFSADLIQRNTSSTPELRVEVDVEVDRMMIHKFLNNVDKKTIMEKSSTNKDEPKKQ